MDSNFNNIETNYLTQLFSSTTYLKSPFHLSENWQMICSSVNRLDSQKDSIKNSCVVYLDKLVYSTRDWSKRIFLLGGIPLCANDAINCINEIQTIPYYWKNIVDKNETAGYPTHIIFEGNLYKNKADKLGVMGMFWNSFYNNWDLDIIPYNYGMTFEFPSVVIR